MFVSVNLVRLEACLRERESVRFTPAGVPICDCLLEHESQQAEGGHDRTVHLAIATRFAAGLAERIAAESLGARLAVEGFLAPKRMARDGRASGAMRLHASGYRRVADLPAATTHS